MYIGTSCRDYFYHAKDVMRKTDFIMAINQYFGSGGMFCTLSDIELGNYLLKKVLEFMKAPKPRVLTAVETVGQQDVDPPVFLLPAEVCGYTHNQIKNYYCKNGASSICRPLQLHHIFVPKIKYGHVGAYS